MCGFAVCVLARPLDDSHLLSLPTAQRQNHPPANAQLRLQLLRHFFRCSRNQNLVERSVVGQTFIAITEKEMWGITQPV